MFILTERIRLHISFFPLLLLFSAMRKACEWHFLKSLKWSDTRNKPTSTDGEENSLTIALLNQWIILCLFV